MTTASSPVGSPAAKRPRIMPIPDDPSCYFIARITQPGALKALVENISHIIAEIEIAVEKSDEFTGIRIEMLDDMRVCMVMAKLPCEVYLNSAWLSVNPTGTFRINSEALLLVMRQVESQYTVDISQRVDDDRITCQSCEHLTQRDVLVARIPTLALQSTGVVKLKDVAVTFDVVLQLHTMRSVIKMCGEINAPDVMLKIEEAVAPNGETHEIFSISADGSRMEMRRQFVGVRDDDDTIQVDESQGAGDIDTQANERRTVFSEAYSTKYLNNFLRSMSRTTVELKLSPQQPLFLRYPLGTRDASVTFVLAPKNDDV